MGVFYKAYIGTYAYVQGIMNKSMGYYAILKL